jgi:elongation factor Ts
MPEITAKMVKELRDRTDAGMMDCKKALTEAAGDMDQAIDFLRKAGITKAAKKSGRAATEGRVVIEIADGSAVAVEVLCETDFVAKSNAFMEYSQDLAKRILADYNGEQDLTGKLMESETERIGELVSKIGENIQVRRAVRWESDAGFAAYLHMGGKIGVMVEVAGETDDELSNDICMHVAAFNPRYVEPGQIDDEAIEKEREIACAQVEGKPKNIIDKIVDGKINKWYTEVCLTKQPWLRDDKQTLEKVAPKAQVRRFIRWQVGEEL